MKHWQVSSQRRSPKEEFPGCDDGSSKSEKDSSPERRLRRLFPEARRSSCFTSKAFSRLSRAAEHRTRFHFKGRLGSQYPHFLSTIGTRVLHSFQHHRPRSRMRANIPDVPHRDVASGLCWGEENSIGPVRRQAPRTERPMGQRGVGRDQLAVLGLLDPERGKPQARYGLAQTRSRGNSRSLAVEGLYADNLRSITDLAPRESFAVFGLIDSGEMPDPVDQGGSLTAGTRLVALVGGCTPGRSVGVLSTVSAASPSPI